MVAEFDSARIATLIADKECETQVLEFKEVPDPIPDGMKSEFCKDISAFANSVGGTILYGIKEDDSKAAAQATGVQNPKSLIDSLEQLALSGIRPRIGLSTSIVEIEGKSVVVVRIPKSLRAPHMIIRHSALQMWVRHGRHCNQMEVEEIRECVRRGETGDASREGFIAKKVADQVHGAELSEVNRKKMIFMAMPISPKNDFVETNDPTIVEMLRNNPNPTGRWCDILYENNSVPTGEGRRTNRDGDVYIEVTRNGCVAAHIPLSRITVEKPQTLPRLNPNAIQDFALSIFETSAQLFDSIEPGTSWVAYVHCLTLADMEAPRVGGLNPYDFQRSSTGRILIGPILSSRYKTTAEVAAVVCDRIWNCFGLDTCPLAVKGR